MKTPEYKTGLILLSSLFVFLLPGCGAVKKASNLPPEIVFSYPSDIPIVKDQDKVCTVFMAANTSLEVDGVVVVHKNGKANKSLRIANKGLIRQQVVDILPGVHTIKLDYMSVDDFGSRRMVRKLSEPIVMEFEFTAGCFYRIIHHPSHGPLLVNELPDLSVREKIGEVRGAFIPH